MSQIIDYLIQQGIPQETIILILILPIIATVIAFARQIIGWKAFGIYTPLITAFAFWAVGLKYGLFVFLIVLITGMLVRFIIKKLRLLYLPRVAIILTIVALAVLSLLFFTPSISIFPILIIITLLEEFIGAQIKKGLRSAVILSLETIFLAIVCYYLIIWTWLQNTLLNYPWIIILTIIFNIIIGKWTGLRLTEYLRFRHVKLSQNK